MALELCPFCDKKVQWCDCGKTCSIIVCPTCEYTLEWDRDLDRALIEERWNDSVKTGVSKTPDYYFEMGAEAMRSRIAAILMIKKEYELAPKILSLELPSFRKVEAWNLANGR